MLLLGRPDVVVLGPRWQFDDLWRDVVVGDLREQVADFVDVPDRGLEMEDFAVIDFDGSLEGKPIGEIAPQASKSLQGAKKFWLRLASDNFIPRFCEQIVGQKPGETRTVTIDFPAEFPVKELAGKQATYNVTLREIKQRVLPPLDDTGSLRAVPSAFDAPPTRAPRPSRGKPRRFASSSVSTRYDV